MLSTAGVLKKHNLLLVVGKTLSEVATVAAVRRETGDTDGDVEMDEGEVHNTPSDPPPLGSSLTETGSPNAAADWPAKIRALLDSVCCVLLYLQTHKPSGEKGGNIVAVLRGTPEFGAQVLGSYFDVCLGLLWSGQGPEEMWTQAVVGVWRSCIWGNPDSEKARFVSLSCSAIRISYILTVRNLAFKRIFHFLSHYSNPIAISAVHSVRFENHARSPPFRIHILPWGHIPHRACWQT